MRPSAWIATTLALFALGCALVFGSSYAIDLFGIFHDPTGKQLSVQHNERTAKFFLNERYVPANFDALLVGGSSTSNFRMDALDFARFYNESLYGSNAVEEKRLVDEALRRGHFRYAICVINPYLLQSHEFNEGSGVPPRREALGSVNLIREEFYAGMRKIRHSPNSFWPEGGQAMPPSKGFMGKDLEFTFKYDPIAVEAFQQTLDELRASGTKIIFFETGVYEPMYQRHRQQFDAFYAAFPLRHADEPLIDFNAPEYAAFRSDASRWVDPPHLTDSSAAQASAELNRVVHQKIVNLPVLPNSQILKR